MNWPLFGRDESLRSILDAFASPVLIMDRHLHILDLNTEAKRFLNTADDDVLDRLCGEIIGCAHIGDTMENCGETPHCAQCAIRQSVAAAVSTGVAQRRTAWMSLTQVDGDRRVWARATASPFKHELQELILLTIEDVTELAELRRIVPICSHCRKVRDSQDFWRHVEEFLRKDGGVEFTHGLCDECTRELYPDQADILLGEEKSS